jgi:hypothetical protein
MEKRGFKLRDLTTKEENLIDDFWTAAEQWDSCDGMAEGNEKNAMNVLYKFYITILCTAVSSINV